MSDGILNVRESTQPQKEHVEPQHQSSSSGDRLLLEHTYDGIQEYDNPMPRWWKITFWATAIFGFGYWLHYHWGGDGVSVAQAYAQEMRAVAASEAARALESDEVTEESLAALLKDPAQLEIGQKKYAAVCAACHAAQGEGLIGPNLTDLYSLHGEGKLMDIYKVVSDGVVDKGMPAWARTMSSAELKGVVAYVGSLRGKNLPGKEPQGQAFVLSPPDTP